MVVEVPLSESTVPIKSSKFDSSVYSGSSSIPSSVKVSSSLSKPSGSVIFSLLAVSVPEVLSGVVSSSKLKSSLSKSKSLLELSELDSSSNPKSSLTASSSELSEFPVFNFSISPSKVKAFNSNCSFSSGSLVFSASSGF